MGRNKLVLILLATCLVYVQASEVTDALEVQDSSQEIDLPLDAEDAADLAQPEVAATADEDEIITLQDIELFPAEAPTADPLLDDVSATDDEERQEEPADDETSTRTERKMNNANAKRTKVNKLRPAAPKGEAKQRISPTTIASEETNQVVDTLIEQLNAVHHSNSPRHLVAVANLRLPSSAKSQSPKRNPSNQPRSSRLFLEAALRTELDNNYVKYSVGEVPTDYAIERKLNLNSSAIDFDILERQQLGDQKNKKRYNAVISGLDRMKRNGDIAVASRQKVQVLRVPVLLGPVELEFKPTVNDLLRESRVVSKELPATLILKRKETTFTSARLMQKSAGGAVAQQILIPSSLESREKEASLVSHLSLEMQRLWNRSVLVNRTKKQISQYFSAARKMRTNAATAKKN